MSTKESWHHSSPLLCVLAGTTAALFGRKELYKAHGRLLSRQPPLLSSKVTRGRSPKAAAQGSIQSQLRRDVPGRDCHPYIYCNVCSNRPVGALFKWSANTSASTHEKADTKIWPPSYIIEHPLASVSLLMTSPWSWTVFLSSLIMLS